MLWALGAMMDSDTNTDISITNGKVTDTGTRSVLLSISAPGLYEYTNINEFKSLNKVTITYNTTDFEINDIYIGGFSKNFIRIRFRNI